MKVNNNSDKKILRIDHVSLAVNEFEKAVEFFSKILGATSQSNGAEGGALEYYWEIFALGDLSRFEIIKKTVENGSFLDNFLEGKKDGGVHHLTLQTPDIEMTKKSLEDNNIPYFGYRDTGNNWKEVFIHPKHAFGVLLQIAEFVPDDWIAPLNKMPKGQKWEVSKKGQVYFLTFAHPGGGEVKRIPKGERSPLGMSSAAAKASPSATFAPWASNNITRTCTFVIGPGVVLTTSPRHHRLPTGVS